MNDFVVAHKRGAILLALFAVVLLPQCVNGSKPANASDLVDKLDRDGDGALSRSEVPQRMQRLRDSFDVVDANGDGKITKAEFAAIQGRGRAGGRTQPPPRTPRPTDTGPGPVPGSTPVITGSGAQAIDARLQRAVSDKELPGAVVVFTHNGEVVFEKTYGYADLQARRPYRMDDLFNLGSTSKPIAMTTIMTLVDQGRLSLDDPVSKWLPEFANKQLSGGGRARRSPTVREMMSHISGIFGVRCGEKRDLTALYMFRRTLSESADAIATKPLVNEPGQRFCYGGPSMQVLGRIAEIVTGQEFDTLASNAVFDPLRMNDTFYRTDRDLSDRMPVIYERSGNSLTPSRRTRNPKGDPFILVPGGLFSTAHDLRRFVLAHLENGALDGERVLSADLTRQMRTSQIGNKEMDFGDPSTGERNSAALGDIEGYGLGWILAELEPDQYGPVFSHGGAYGTYIWGDANAQLGAILLTQTPLTNATPVWEDVLQLARNTWTADGVASASATSAAAPGATSSAGTLRFDCTDSAACPALQVRGEPAPTLGNGALSIKRGTVDASVLSDPDSDTVYLAYTWITSHEGASGGRLDGSVNLALAESSDSGRSFRYQGMLRPSVEERDPVSGKSGYASQEVASLARGEDEWYLAYLRFHDPKGNGNNRRSDSFHIEVARASSLDSLARADSVRYGGSMAAGAWKDYDFSTLHGDLRACSLWLDPELHVSGGRLYLLSVCIPFQSSRRLSEDSFYAVFELQTSGSGFGRPSYLGKLGTGRDAASFGANELSKADLAYSRDGTLLFITSPVFKGSAGFEEYTGCYVFEVESLNPPALVRDSRGVPVARAVFTSSDSEPTGASCAYDPASETGVVYSRREMRPQQRKLVWSLHATGVHP